MLARLCLTAAFGVSATSFAGVEAGHFRGALMDDVPVRLQNAAVYFEADGSETPVEQLTREQLEREAVRLDHSMPTIGGPIVVTAIGGVLLFSGLLIAGAAFSAGNDLNDTARLIIGGFGGVLLIAGAIMVTVGLIKLFVNLGGRRTAQQRLDEIKARLDAYDRSAPPVAPPPPTDLPPPPPPPPGAQLFLMEPLARF
jgi:hypothetical protein